MTTTQHAMFEAHIKTLSSRGYKLALWEDGGLWHWIWRIGNMDIDAGSCDAKTKALAFYVATQGVA